MAAIATAVDILTEKPPEVRPVTPGPEAWGVAPDGSDEH